MSSEPVHLPLTPRRGFAVRYYPALGLLALLLTQLGASTFNAELREEPAADPMQSVLVWSTLFAGLTTLLLSLPAGWLADRFATRPILLTAMLLNVGAGGLGAVGGEVPFFVVAACFNGAAIALLLPAGMQLLQELPRDLRGVCIGLCLALTVTGDSLYYSVSYQLGQMTAWSWKPTPLLNASVAVLLAAAIAFVPRSARGECTASATDPGVLPPRAMVHLLVAAALLSGLAQTADTLERFLLAEAEDPEVVRQLYYEASLSSVALSIAGGVIVSFLDGHRLPWIPRMVAIATAVALAGCFVAAASNDPAVAVVAIAAVNACATFVFAVMLTAIGCWVGSKRGIQAAVASISGRLVGGLFSAAFIYWFRTRPAFGLVWITPIIVVWIALHVHWSLRVIHAAGSQNQSHVH